MPWSAVFAIGPFAIAAQTGCPRKHRCVTAALVIPHSRPQIKSIEEALLKEVAKYALP